MTARARFTACQDDEFEKDYAHTKTDLERSKAAPVSCGSPIYNLLVMANKNRYNATDWDHSVQ
jgi:hypothetical protein